MEEKEIKRKYDSFWSFFGYRNDNKFLLPKLFSPNSEAGFTLIELIIDLAILAVLLLLILLLWDPVKQLNKAKDARRRHDFEQIKVALDSYYNDHNCYPASIPFGGEWRDGSAIYMQKVPQDETCRDSNGHCYLYATDTANYCPQWNVLFGKLTIAPTDTFSTCSLSSACVPINYQSAGYNVCSVSGAVDCNILGNSLLPTPTPSVTLTPTPTSPDSLSPTQPVVTPTQTPTPILPSGTPPLYPTPTPCEKNFRCTGSQPTRCNLVPQGTGQYCTSNCDGACQ